MLRKIFFFFAVILMLVFTPQKAFACNNFDLPASVNQGDTFNIQVSGVKTGLSYTMQYQKSLGILIATQDSPKTASGSTISFSAKLDVPGTYQFLLTGKQQGNNVAQDSCAGNGTVVVKNTSTPPPSGSPAPIFEVNFGTPTPTPASIPWFLTGNYTCVQDRRGMFSTKEACEQQAVLKKPKVYPTPSPACKKVDNSYVCDTALGNIDTDPARFVKTIFGILLSLAGGIALLLVMVSGYRLMTSQGNPEKVQAAREQLTSAIVGLLFIIFSLSILQIIGVEILRLPGFK